MAATLCARRGLRCLLLRSGTRPDSYTVDGYRLPTTPLPFPGFGSPAVRRVLDELHFVHPLKRKLQAVGPSFQYVSPDCRLDVTADDVAMLRELSRETTSGEDVAATCALAPQLSRLFDSPLAQDIAVPPIGFWERREIARTADRLREGAAGWLARMDGDALAPLVRAPAIAGTAACADDVSPEAFVRSFDLWRQGAPRLGGDYASLSEVFLDKFSSHNGDLRTARPTALTTSWSKVTGVVLDDGEAIGASHVIAAMPIHELAEVSGAKLGKKLSGAMSGIECSGYRYVLHLVLDEAGIPEGMGRTVLVVADPSAPLVGDNAFAVYVDEPDDQARVVVSVEATLPASAIGGDGSDPASADEALDDALSDLRVGLREKLELVMPFYSEHVLLAHSPNESAPPESGRSSSGSSSTRDEAHVPPRPLWRTTNERFLGVSALSYAVGVKHLTMASSQVLPQLGLEGQFTAGWCAAKLACLSSGKRKDFLKDEVITGKSA